MLHITKKAVSAVVASVMLILIIVALISAIWIAIIPLIEDKINEEMKSLEMSKEQMKILDVVFYSTAVGNATNITIGRGATNFIEMEVEMVTEMVTVDEPVPIDIVLSIDLSGSMNGDVPTRLTIAKAAAADFIEEVLDSNEKAKIGLVGFKGSGNERYNLSNDEGDLKTELNSWTAGGGTYVCSGMNTSKDIFDDGSNTLRQKVLVVLGDGAISTTSCQNVADDLASEFNASYNIKISTIGFGAAGNTPFYVNLAAAGGGTYYNSSNTSTLGAAFSSIVSDIEVTRKVEKEVPVECVFIEVLISTGGDSQSFTITDALPGTNGAKKFTIPLVDIDPDDISKIEIYLVNMAEGATSTSRVLSAWEP